jgi:hypothetical protein
MEETQKAQQNTASGEPNGKRLRLPDLPDLKLGIDGDLNGFDATDSEFLNFVHTLVPVTGENLDHWTWEERRDFLNWCLDEQVLTIQDGRLVPIEEEHIATAPLSENKEMVSSVAADVPKSTEDAGFLRDVEHAKPVLLANPEISAKALADALGLQSALYAHTLQVFLQAQNAPQEGA